MWIPVVIERILIDDHFNRGVADRPAEVVVGLDVHLNFLAQSKGFLLPILLRES